MMEKAVFLDRDGTINIDRQYIYRVKDFEFIPGSIDALKTLQEAGYILIVITNQSGIGRGYYKESDYQILNKWMIDTLLEKYGICITASYFCPHLPNAPIIKYRKECNCRKPKLGLFDRAIREWDISLSDSWSIGDKLRDVSICNCSMCRGILIDKSENPSVLNDVKDGKLERVYYSEDLLSAVNNIVIPFS